MTHLKDFGCALLGLVTILFMALVGVPLMAIADYRHTYELLVSVGFEVAHFIHTSFEK